MTHKDKSQESFTSRWGLLLSMLGIAVGTGNIWRFPRIAAQNSGDDGAGAFLVAWVVFLLVWSIPLIIAEYAIGRHGKKGTIGSFVSILGDKFAWMGGFIGFVAMAIMFYYSVVTAWCFYYFGITVSGGLPNDVVESTQLWNTFQSGYWPTILHAVAIFGGAFIVWKGVSSIERISKILIPSLLVIIIVSLVRAVTLEGSFAGIAYLFTPDWQTLSNPTVWLEALTQNAWDTGAGWGLILTYAAYMKSSDSVTKNAFITGIGNNVVSLMAAIIIFSTVFGTLGTSMSNSEVLDVMKTSGPASTGLTFIWMPKLFYSIPGGPIFAAIFFLGLSFAAFTSLMSMIALSTRIFVDMGIDRSLAAFGVATVGFIIGLPSAQNLDFFANQDFVWGLALMVSGAFISFAVIKYGLPIFRDNLVNTSSDDIYLGKWWDVLIGKLVPIQVIVLLSWWIWRSATEFSPDTWYNPLDPYSVATVFTQWGILIMMLLIFNKQLAKANGFYRKI
jgi:NSS family neurotransmitter:Na+ symporter